MDKKSISEIIVDFMLENDRFSKFLGIEKVEIGTGHCVLRLKVRKDMLNGFDILHGGVAYSLADSALAFASNSHGRKAVSLEAVMNYTAPIKEGDEITATANELNITNNTGLYDVIITNQFNRKVAVFRGTVYRTKKEFFNED